ncbi:hypothetical protein ARMGADRAFT_1017681 [Armillaria gallica]|uniref:Mid2 domain-containing protein n=1 Tax=Armillaria gallica TaxID=47427 RepID=A0A2H3CS59_ARMGA|nr:hypothetical protein ARMGADRAFT_1017681 [Armillaria gallica]
MLLQFILFCFCFATSNGFHFDPIEGNATVGTPFALTWHLDQGEKPDKIHLERRNLQSQQWGKGDNILFQFPDNGTLDGTLMVNFPSPGNYLIEVFEGDNKSPAGGGSGTIGVSSSPDSGTNSGSISTSTPVITTVPVITTSSSSVLSAASTSQGTSYGDPLTSTVSYTEPTPESSATSVYATNVTSASTPSTSTHSGMETAMKNKSAWLSQTQPESSSGSQTRSVSSVSASSTSKQNMTSSALPSKTPLIVGVTVGSFVFLLLLLAALVYTLHRRQWHRKRYPAIFHRDRMIRRRSNTSFSPLTPTAKDSDTYTNFADVEKHTSYSSTYKEDPPPSPQPQQGCLEYSLPAPLAPRSETPSPIPAHTDRQMEIYDVLVKKNTDLIRLKTELRRGGDVEEEIEGLKATITRLEEALVSPWALGYTDEMPYEGLRALFPTQA